MTTQIKTAQKELLDSPHLVPAIDPGNYELSENELRAATLIMSNDMTPRGSKYKHRSYTEIAEELDIDAVTLWRYRNKPEFQRYIRDASASFVSSVVPLAVARLAELADGSISGTPSIKAIQMILEIGNVYNPKTTVEVSANNNGEKVSEEQLAAIVAKYSAVEE